MGCCVVWALFGGNAIRIDGFRISLLPIQSVA